jgi:ribosome biogenesis GTPase
VERGVLSPERLASYQKLQRELAHLDRKQDARARQQEKQRIRSISKSFRHHPKFKGQDGRF